MRLRILSDEEVAEHEIRCGAQPSPRSTVRCEDKPEHWKHGNVLSETHKGRTRRGYWKFWPVTDAEMKSDA